ncbi:Na+/glucose cotransporter [Pseudoxanthomonas kalamensis DSM 18571]|uniref:sodium:solute symporter family transporter n=1 Tax=Pseudoxanthomonas kalamensis TaxID=289483 RepID=UPI0013912772|nr:sodium/solute symporter [Pseudoxanthomonas kalamensis]KAF1711125.1 Na+/glucose cotransporter [Pseudoxanthomonas kalamensis DSM 18571]
MGALHTLDYAVLLAYLLIVIVVCVRVARRSPDSDELFLAGRSLGAGMVGLSLFASNISSTTLIGLPGAAWSSGIAVANYEWMAALVLLFAARFVIPVFLRDRLTTVPELLEKRFDARMRKYLSAVTVFLAIVLDTAGSLYAGALVLQVFFPQLPLTPTIVAIALFAGLYTAAGGLRAVVYTDALQTVVLLAGSALLAGVVFSQFDFSWSRMMAAVPDDHLSLIRPLDDPELPWLGTLIGLPILGFYYWTMNQYVSQRLLGARSVDAAAGGSLIAAALKLLPLFLMVLPGAMAAALLPDLQRGDEVFAQLIRHYAPVGVAGLILAGLLAAIMSSVDSALNSASTLISVDFVQPHRPGMDTRALARLGRVLTLVLMALAALWAPQIQHFPGLFAYLQQAFAYVTPPLVAVFVMAMWNRRIGADAAFLGTLSGHALSLAWFAATQLGWANLHFSIVAGVLFAATCGFILLWQLLRGRPADAQQLAAVASPQAAALPALPLRLGMLLVALLTFLLVLAFW